MELDNGSYEFNCRMVPVKILRGKAEDPDSFLAKLKDVVDLPQNKLDPEIKALWLETLRSEKYQQGMRYLHYAAGYCCLGVLCNELKVRNYELPEGRVRSQTNLEENGESFMYGHKESTVTLPETLAVELGISDSGDLYLPVMVNGEEYAVVFHSTYDYSTLDLPMLTVLNDGGFTFDQIADLIEWAF